MKLDRNEIRAGLRPAPPYILFPGMLPPSAILPTTLLPSMCNAANHPSGCDCGFGGDTGGGGRHWGSVSNFVENYAPPSFGWARDHGGTVESYVNPNAHCPVCGRSVFFYRSPYGGRAFFDDLGWPSPKHGCTDNRGEPRRAARNSMVPKSTHETGWHREGWSPLLSPRVAWVGDHFAVGGDLDEGFVDLILPSGCRIDRDTPVLMKRTHPGIFRMTCLASDPNSTKPVETVAFDTRLAGIGDDAVRRAADGEAAGLHAIGSSLLWQCDDPAGARSYLQAAAAAGSVEAAIDLLVIVLFKSSPATGVVLPATEITL